MGQWCENEARRHYQLAEIASRAGNYPAAREHRAAGAALYSAAAEWCRYERMGASYTPSEEQS